MCDLNDAFKLMIEETPGMTYKKLAMMIGEENHKKLQALFDPDRGDRPFQMKHMIPTMAACDTLSPLHLMNAHFGLSAFKLNEKDMPLDQAILPLLEGVTGVVSILSKTQKSAVPGGVELTTEECKQCLKQALSTMSVLTTIVNNLKKNRSF